MSDEPTKQQPKDRMSDLPQQPLDAADSGQIKGGRRGNDDDDDLSDLEIQRNRNR